MSIFVYRPGVSIFVYRPGMSIFDYRPGMSVFVYRPGMSIFVYRPGMSIFVYRLEMSIFVHRPELLVFVYKPELLVFVYRPELSVFAYSSKLTIFVFSNSPQNAVRQDGRIKSALPKVIHPTPRPLPIQQVVVDSDRNSSPNSTISSESRRTYTVNGENNPSEEYVCMLCQPVTTEVICEYTAL